MLDTILGCGDEVEEGGRRDPINASTNGSRQLIHPFFVLRLAGLPAGVVDELTDGCSVALLQEIDRLQTQSRVLAVSVAETISSIYPRLAANEDVKTARIVLQLKRDLFNLRECKAASVLTVMPYLAQTERDILQELVCRLGELAALKQTWPKVYASELERGQTALSHLFQRENLNAALQISNPSLYRRLYRFFDSPKPQCKPKYAEGYRISLINYALRASQKISPLSSLGIVVVGKWCSTGQQILRPALAFSDFTVKSEIHLRHAPFQSVLRPLLNNPNYLHASAPLRLNETLRRDDSIVRWTKILADESAMDRICGARHGTAQIPLNKATELLILAFGEFEKNDATVATLTTALRARLPQHLWPSIGSILYSAMQYGLVGFAGEPGAQMSVEEWIAAIRPYLREDTTDQGLSKAMNALELATCRIRSADRRELADHVEHIESAFDELSAASGKIIRATDARPLVHEDCSLDVPMIVLNHDVMAAIHRDTGRLLEAASFLGNARMYGAISRFIAARFIQRFGKEGRCTDLESFLMETADAFMAPSISDVAESAAERTIDEVSDSFFAQLLENIENANDQFQLEIQPQLLAAHVARLPAAMRARRVSHCINGQFVTRVGEQIGFVVNQVYPGNSRMLSRFLPKDDQARDAVTGYLGQIASSGRYAAIPGVFGFAANRHSNFADVELRIPPFDVDNSSAKSISLSECELRFDDRTEQVYLHGPDGLPMDAFYLGIQMTFRLPQVHQMLDAMRNTCDGLPQFWRSIAQRMPGFGREIVNVPRITMGTLTLARRTVCIPREMVPSTDCSEAAFFERMQQWRLDLDLPREVYYHQEDQRFIGLRSLSPNEGMNKEALNTLRKLIKPTYLDFSSPLTVALMRRNRMLQNVDLVVSEALPSRSDMLASVAGSGHVCELSFETTILPTE